MTEETEEIQKLKDELQIKIANLNSKQANCSHDWLEVKYDPEEILVQYCTGEYETMGVHVWPKTAYRKDKKDRWSRTCKICGKIEYGYEKKATKYEPYFK